MSELEQERGRLVRQWDERQEAERRAYELLCAYLTPTQLRELRERGHFIARGSVSGREYRIHRGRIQNVWWVQDDPIEPVTHTWCASPIDPEMPTGDILLAQKFLIETDENQFLAIANHWSR